MTRGQLAMYVNAADGLPGETPRMKFGSLAEAKAYRRDQGLG